ncbi:STAS domain-containing protein [Streptacidiphilus sp. PB12-B1b]|uniref:STAS domain-containing protein n=1 Tax=Streptacidiphilus sp. PB12-B1b TaxID=2705012 RepID=UPI0015FE0FEB|nr:STAS domain-containing protein [Streptacidiphilus sp. PB12-B1b]QMU76793.1 STAS domain-containing protein [Streptacidiphilus sp. PB12-B1b]
MNDHASLDVVALDRGTIAEIMLVGELDLDADEQVRLAVTGALIDPQVRQLDIEVSLVTFCDSSGLNALTRAYQQTRTAGVTLRLVNVGRQLRRVLDLTGLWDVLNCTEAEAP